MVGLNILEKVLVMDLTGDEAECPAAVIRAMVGWGLRAALKVLGRRERES